MTSLFQNFGSFNLLRAEWWNNASVREPAQTLDVVWIPFRVHSWVRPFLEVEDWTDDVWFFAF